MLFCWGRSRNKASSFSLFSGLDGSFAGTSLSSSEGKDKCQFFYILSLSRVIFLFWPVANLNMRTICRTLLWLSLIFPLNTLVFAQEGVLSGTEIIKKSRNLLYKIDDQKSTVTLWLIERNGTMKRIVVSRYWKNYRSELGFDSKMLLVTEFPTDSRGVAFLVWDYVKADQANDLRLYLPALNMVRKISGQDLNDAFLGSDLTFADIGQRRLHEDRHRLLREEVYQGADSYIVESIPKEKESIYGKKVSWVSKKDWTLLKIDYYDQGQKLLKRQIIEWQAVDHFLVWKRINVTNIQNGHRTVFDVSALQVNIGLKDEDFTEQALKAGSKR